MKEELIVGWVAWYEDLGIISPTLREDKRDCERSLERWRCEAFCVPLTKWYIRPVEIRFTDKGEYWKLQKNG